MPIPLRLQSGNRVHRTCIGASYVPLRPAPTSRLHAAQVGRRTPWWTRTAAVGDGLIEPVAAGSTADTAPVTDIELDDIGLEAAGGLEAELKNLVAPSVRLQQPLPGKERAALRTEAEQMMRDHKLIQVQVRAQQLNNLCWPVTCSHAGLYSTCRAVHAGLYIQGCSHWLRLISHQQQASRAGRKRAVQAVL